MDHQIKNRSPRRWAEERLLARAQTGGESGSLILDILIGMAIFALIAIIAVSAISQYRERAYEQGAVSDAKSLGTALEADYTDTQSYPVNLDTLPAGVTPTKGVTVADYVTGGGKFAFCVEHESGGTPDAWAVYNSDKGGLADSGRGAGCEAAEVAALLTLPGVTPVDGDPGDGDAAEITPAMAAAMSVFETVRDNALSQMQANGVPSRAYVGSDMFGLIHADPVDPELPDGATFTPTNMGDFPGEDVSMMLAYDGSVGVAAGNANLDDGRILLFQPTEFADDSPQGQMALTMGYGYPPSQMRDLLVNAMGATDLGGGWWVATPAPSGGN